MKRKVMNRKRKARKIGNKSKMKKINLFSEFIILLQEELFFSFSHYLY